MPVRTAVLAHGVLSALNTFVVVYTCPGGRTAIAKDLRVSNNAVEATRVILAVLSGAEQTRVINTQVADGGTATGQGFIVLEPGDQLTLFTGTNAVRYHVSGSELDGVAP